MGEWSKSRARQEPPGPVIRRQPEDSSQKGGLAVTARSADPAIAGLRASAAEAAKEPSRTGNVLYQGATVLAILLFLISFWSC